MLSFFHLLLFLSSFSLSLFSLEYEIDDKKLLELTEEYTQYNADSDINLEKIIPFPKADYDTIKKKPKIYISENYEKTKLIHYFESYALYLNVDRSTIAKLRTSPLERIYFFAPNPQENYYGINRRTLIGLNLIGKMVEKMIYDRSYIQRINQKISVSDDTINELHTNAAARLKENRHGWKNVQDAIYFYDKNEEFYAFTNFFESEVYIDGFIWPTSEHYYQAMKYTKHPRIQVIIYTKPTAREAFNSGSKDEDNTPFIDTDWQQRSLKTMIKIVWLKFNQHETLKQLLLSTDDKILVENAGKNDDFYGAGENFKGKNWLGCILMAVRDKLKMSDKAVFTPPSSAISTQSKTPIKTKNTGQSDRTSKKNTPPVHEKGFFVRLWEWFMSLFSRKP
ncbi:MAG TPA: NADAR family protein [Patescibacteria group bacterium]|jgi:ribA/ribD-fused uncharacterized protein|nr:NADAR family protein [Patescibacteria group bacterium]